MRLTTSQAPQYEYLLKGWLLSGKTEVHLLQMRAYLSNRLNGLFTVEHTDMEAMRSAVRQLVFLSRSRHLMYMTELRAGKPTGNFQHLTCFFPGLLALTIQVVPDTAYMDNEKEVFEYVAEGLANTCYILYADSLTGLGPEEVRFLPYNGDDDYASGKWLKHLERWRSKPFRGTKPPGVQEPTPRRGKDGFKDYEYRDGGWFLRPEVRCLHSLASNIFHPTFCLGVRVDVFDVENDGKHNMARKSLENVPGY